MKTNRSKRIISAAVLAALTAACSPASIPSPATAPVSPTGAAQSAVSATATAASPITVAASVPGFTLILGRPTATSITASVLSDKDRSLVLDYGTGPGLSETRTPSYALKANAPLDVEISGLRPDATYYYRVVADGVPPTERTFHTQRAPGDGFVFTIDADPHFGDPNFSGPLYTTTLGNAASEDPDFHVNLGDTFMTEKGKATTYDQAAATFTGMRPYLATIGAEAPLFLVNGNHEGELGWLLAGKDKTMPTWCVTARQAYYPNPVPNAFYSGATATDSALGAIRDGYYAWTWGDALFVVLDPFWYTAPKPSKSVTDDNWQWTLGRAQYDWLSTTLGSGSSKYKFVFTHHLVGGAADARGGSEFANLYEWGGDNADGSYGFDEQRPGWGKPIHQLLVENHATAVFHGHDHVYVKQDLDGIVYQEVPQPSVTLYNSEHLATDYGYTHGEVRSSSGHLRVTVGAKGVTVDYIRAYLPADQTGTRRNGQVSYAYSI
jgi:hypothetical protein